MIFKLVSRHYNSLTVPCKRVIASNKQHWHAISDPQQTLRAVSLSLVLPLLIPFLILHYLFN